MTSILKSNHTSKNKKSDEMQNGQEKRYSGIYKIAERFAETYIGHVIMHQVDRLLWTLEKTATWIANGKTDGKKSKAPKSLVRPLPWILFLPALVILRYTRIALSLVFICLGFDEIEASAMTSFFHDSRQRLGAITRKAKRKADKKKYNSSYLAQARHYLSLLMFKLSSTFGKPSNAFDVDESHNNKTSLNAIPSNENESDSSYNSDDDSDDDSEDQPYKDLLSRSFPDTDDNDDEDYIPVNGDETSDGELSEVSEHLSDDNEADLESLVLLETKTQSSEKIIENGGNGAHDGNSDNESIETDKESQSTEQQQQQQQSSELPQDKQKQKSLNAHAGNHKDKQMRNSAAHPSNKKSSNNRNSNQINANKNGHQNNGQHGVNNSQN